MAYKEQKFELNCFYKLVDKDYMQKSLGWRK